MDKTRILCAVSAYMMKEFSARTIEGLNQHKLFKLILPAFTSFLDVNVSKEIEKDRQIVLCAVNLKTEGKVPSGEDIERLLQISREIDQKFLQEINTLAASIDIRYSDIEKFRRSRIDKILNTVYQICLAWDSSRDFRTAVSSCYSRDQLLLFLREIFSLYIEETRMLSTSVKIPRKLIFARDSLIRKVGSVMDQVAENLTVELADAVFCVESS